MQKGDRVISNDGENDFIGDFSHVEDNLLYFTVDDDQYFAPLASVSLCGHIDGHDVWKATTYEG